jgi:hypothetical protein
VAKTAVKFLILDVDTERKPGDAHGVVTVEAADAFEAADA